MKIIENPAFTRNDLELTGAILRCEGRITDLVTGRIIELDGLTVDDAIAEISTLSSDVHGVGWKHSDTHALIPLHESITVHGEAGEFVKFTCFMSVRFFRTWASRGQETNHWERHRQAACATRQRKLRSVAYGH